MPTQFLQVETSVISGMQKLLYLNEVKSSDIIVRYAHFSSFLLYFSRSDFSFSFFPLNTCSFFSSP